MIKIKVNIMFPHVGVNGIRQIHELIILFMVCSRKKRMDLLNLEQFYLIQQEQL